MLSVRKVKTASGAIAVQVVQYEGHRCKIVKHIGSSKEEAELRLLIQKAREWISTQTGQSSLFSEQRQKILFVDRGECIGVRLAFAREFLLQCAHQCGLAGLSALLMDLAIMRLIEPASKLRSVELLNHYFGIFYSQRIYRNIPKLIKLKALVEQHAFSLAVNEFHEPFYFVLYDVTTLYFETGKSDELRVPGFSKDNKPQQPQIVIGLLVTQSGFPLSYEVFAGNTFEGHTMLPIIEKFMASHKHSKPIVVADAAMLSEERLAELKDRNISYIVGARLANSSIDFINKVHSALSNENTGPCRFPSIHGHIVCDFSLKRYKKELYELNQQIKKAEELVAKQSDGKRVKFIKKVSKQKIEINTALIDKHRLLLGIKGYTTNIAEEGLSNQKVIEYYHQLWRIEQSFRMSKTDLQTRPVFHRREDAIRSHILICFVALILEKYLELKTQLSLRQIRFLIWNITESHIQDTLTKEVFIFRSPTEEIMRSPLAPWIKKWNLLPH
jgi:hypothetical protein